MRQLHQRHGISHFLTVVCFVCALSSTSSPAAAQFGGGGGPAVGGGDALFLEVRDPIIQVAAYEFHDELIGDSVWVEAEVTDVEFLRKERAELPICFGMQIAYPLIHRLQIKVERPLFGREKPPETLELKEVRVGPEFWRENGFQQPPHVGDRVFAQLAYDAQGTWSTKFIGVPSDHERKRIDRVKDAYEEANTSRAIEELFAGFLDEDPHYAIWCMTVIEMAACGGSHGEREAYRRFGGGATAERYQAALFQILETPFTPAESYVHALDNLGGLPLSAADWERCHQANYVRLRNYYSNPPDLQNAQELRTLIRSLRSPKSTAQRLTGVKILGEFAAKREMEPRLTSFRCAYGLYLPEDKAVNEAIFKIYRDQMPRGEMNRELLQAYWRGLAELSWRELRSSGRFPEASFDLFEQQIPTARQNELEAIMYGLRTFGSDSQRHKAGWDRFTEHLEMMYSLAASPQQREAFVKLYGQLKLPVPSDART